jgi:dipeptidyl aminopeptidase/acylaminoacyl peptidase
MRLKKVILWTVVTVFICAGGGIFGLAANIYNTFLEVMPECRSISGEAHSFTPAQFTQAGLDTSNYLMSDYETVRFPSRDARISLTGFYIPAEDETAPTVIIVHGYQSCKNSSNSLLPAGMLHRNGYNVLVIDLRNMGTSDIDNGRMAGGTKEYLDVLGAWDWLIVNKNVPPERIGLFGYSLGGASSLIAMGREAQVAAVWSDSSYADIQMVIDDIMGAEVFRALIPLGLLVGRFISGDDILSVKPLDVIPEIAGRPVYVTHGTADGTVYYRHAPILAEALDQAGSLAGFWTVEGSEHVSAMFDHPVEYETRLIDFFDEVFNDQPDSP